MSRRYASDYVMDMHLLAEPQLDLCRLDCHDTVVRFDVVRAADSIGRQDGQPFNLSKGQQAALMRRDRLRPNSREPSRRFDLTAVYVLETLPRDRELHVGRSDELARAGRCDGTDQSHAGDLAEHVGRRRKRHRRGGHRSRHSGHPAAIRIVSELRRASALSARVGEGGKVSTGSVRMAMWRDRPL